MSIDCFIQRTIKENILTINCFKTKSKLTCLNSTHKTTKPQGSNSCIEVNSEPQSLFLTFSLQLPKNTSCQSLCLSHYGTLQFLLFGPPSSPYLLPSSQQVNKIFQGEVEPRSYKYKKKNKGEI